MRLSPLFSFISSALIHHARCGNSSPPKIYVALGDSLAAGVNAGPDHLGQPPACSQSDGSYAAQFSLQNNPGQFIFLACHNTTIDQVREKQSPHIPQHADLVSFTAGTMDFGLPDLIEKCDLYPDPADQGTCNQALGYAESQATKRDDFNAVYTTMQYLIGSIRWQAANAMIVILGYAKPIGNPVGDCYLHNMGQPRLLETTMAQKNWLNKIFDEMNQTLGTVAKMLGAKFIDPNDSFAWHRYCDEKYSQSNGWTFFQSLTTGYSGAWDTGYFLPDAMGHAAYASLLAEAWSDG